RLSCSRSTTKRSCVGDASGTIASSMSHRSTVARSDTLTHAWSFRTALTIPAAVPRRSIARGNGAHISDCPPQIESASLREALLQLVDQCSEARRRAPERRRCGHIHAGQARKLQWRQTRSRSERRQPSVDRRLTLAFDRREYLTGARQSG